MRKSFMRSLAILGMVGVMSVNTFGMTFKDVSDKHWAYNSVLYMQQKGYMVTNSQGEFFPNNQVTYFEVAEILAKATGYQDENVVKDMDPKFKQEIRDNYAKQKPTLDRYAAKYKGWKGSANEEIAYLLGRGYIKEADLDKFMVKAQTGQEVAQVVTKEDLAVYLVRVLQREKSATESYKGTGFKDEAKIAQAARPHVAYLKGLGIVGADSHGNFNPQDKVTRAVCAKMTAESLKIRDKETETKPTEPTNPGQAQTEAMSVKVNKIVVKDQTTGELYLLVEKEDKSTTFYSMKKTAKVTDLSGKVVSATTVKAGDQVKIKIAKENGTEYITELQIQSNAPTTGGGTTTPETTTPGTTTPETTPSQTTLYTGTVERIGKSGDVTLTTDKGTYTFLLADGVTVDQLAVGDVVKAYVQNSKITRIEVTGTGDITAGNTKGELVSVVQKVDEYIIKVKQGSKETEVKVSRNVFVTRNDKKSAILDLKVGDQLEFKMTGKEITEIYATSEKKTYKGKIQSILIAKQPQITVTTSSGAVTFNVTANTELFDTNTKSDISIRDLQVGAQVELVTESKEAVSVIVDKAPSNVSYKGVIDSVSKGGKTIDVVVEYDPITGETMTIKRINVSSDVKITVSGKEETRDFLEEGMEVVVKYKYGEEVSPIEIMVLSR